MSSAFRAVSCALLTGALLAAPAAEARFGKRSDSSDDSDRSESRVHDATPVQQDSGSSGTVHDATPVSQPPPPPPEPSPEPYYPPAPPVYVGPAEPDPTYVTSEPPGVSWDEERFAARHHRNFTLGLEGSILQEGSAVGLHLGVEGERLGAFLRTSGLTLRADDGSGEKDSISVTELHASVAVLKGWAGRLRLEGGLSIAKAPDVTFVGPSVGISSELFLLDFLSLEARAQFTPWPYRQLDAAGGMVWYLGGWRLFALRGGVRALVLNDAGKVDGVVHQDVLPGPYLAFGLAI
ncbi:hypothetical protein [Vitiosangium sp. GDMCC 1.1324]|uniref:hypothetical protein n=1 Tax=Vitiosangium sp. (strain GDMCC 1.1324) TaxID=2138576 RepID=UPI000D395963|nr:hypothetical protein [Vitiosangium sp. GDMCC 1.1324]PTL77917.1 hypothetical protein DAT35_42735 [Vitiosangium sp. GDMCC 1.1324]